MVIFPLLLVIYTFVALYMNKNKNLFLFMAFFFIIAHSLFLYVQFGQSTGGSDENYYIENALALNNGWNSFISLREYLPSSYYAYSIFVHWVSIGINNEFIWIAMVRLCNALIVAIALIPYTFEVEQGKSFGRKISAIFIYIVSLWLVLFNFRDSHILAIILSLYSINYILKVNGVVKILLNTALVVLIYFYKPELYAIIFLFPVVKIIVKRFINKNYGSAKIVLFMLLMFIPITFIKLPPPLDYLALRMVHNNEVDVNEHTQLQYDPLAAYEQGDTTLIGKTIAERVYKRFPIIFVGYNPLVMLFDYTKSFNSKFGIDLSVVSYIASQIMFFIYYFLLNPILILLLLKKRFKNDAPHQYLISLFIVTIFYYSLYNVLQGSAQPRITIPLAALVMYAAYRSNFIDSHKKELSNIMLFIMLPVMLIHYIFYAFNLIS